ncbi:WbqC family protein [Streptomyces sp. NBC_00663]|uniref:WbqC family protein n=1 Tax=Streptomyces sp. NBC_00663 TaxID=2975801 RepID=UPI002E3534A2|nr:WbqC family protein [Streptomyces sp. NBC_00663]
MACNAFSTSSSTLSTAPNSPVTSRGPRLSPCTVLGWQGEVVDSSTIQARDGRSQRLADLAAATRSTHYLCGTGGLRYHDTGPFHPHSIRVLPFHVPVEGRLWQSARRISGLWALGEIGPRGLASELTALGDLPGGKRSRERAECLGE